jgi:hypothetical protein
MTTMTATVSIAEARTALARRDAWRVYAENTTSRSAFYEAGSDGAQGWYRYGRIGSEGTTKHTTPYDALQRVQKKVWEGAYVERIRGTQRAAPTTPRAPAPPKPAPSLRDRLSDTTMRVTTLSGWWETVGTQRLRKLPDDASQYRDLYPGSLAVKLWADPASALWVTALHADDSITFGKVSER